MAKIETVDMWKDENGEINRICIIYEDRKYRHYPAAKIPGTAKTFLEKAEKVSERNSGSWVCESYMIVEHKEEGTEKVMISRIEAENAVNEWNEKIDNFMANELPKLLESEGVRVKNGKISMNDWFKAQGIVQKQNFYEEGHSIQMKLRNAGHDVKMDMQNHKLVFPRW